MRVTLLAFGVLRDHLGATGSLELPAGATVRDLLERCRAETPPNGPLWSSIAVAVNEEYASNTQVLADGDEVALLPPVSGGAPAAKKAKGVAPVAPVTRIALTRRRLDAAAVAGSLKRGEDGAVVVFDGIVRNNSRGRPTKYLFYEAYEEMALRQMQMLAAQAVADYPIRDAAILHRLGRLEIGESSVVIAVASAHRAAAFDACRWLIDTLKQSVPIWKKEFFVDGAEWAHGDPFPPAMMPNARKSPADRRAPAATKRTAAKPSSGSRTAQRERAR
jgi:MoaE-MoaD fusion protein